MGIDETKEFYFGTEQTETIKENLPEIIRVLENQTDKLIIACRDVEYLEIVKKKNDPSYLSDENLKFIDNGISVLLANEAVSEMLKSHIPRSVKELTVPFGILRDITVLKEFPNLESLTISDYIIFDPEEIEWISKNTNIKTLNLRLSGTFDRIKSKKGFNILECGYKIADCNGLRIKCDNILGRYYSNASAYLDSYESLPVLQSLYEEMSPELTDLRSITIVVSASPTENSTTIQIDPTGEVSSISFVGVSPTNAAQIFNVVQRERTIKTTNIRLDNKTYNDIHQLKSLAQNSELTIKYRRTNSAATYDEFKSMRATIDYYRELIETANLSPAEKVAYVYDILKTWKYQENKADKSRSREIHAIVEDGTIVCVGYSEFANQLLSELGIATIDISITSVNEDGKTEHHQRNIVRIDDDKHNIHGLFALDITWDSDRDVSIIEEDGKKTIISRPSEKDQEKIIDRYDALSLYRHFLIPLQDYEIRYPSETRPEIYREYRDGNAARLVHESREARRIGKNNASIKNNATFVKHNILFAPEEGHLTVEKYFTAPKPSLETLESILKNVRIAQGYTPREAAEDVERVVQLHEMLYNQSNGAPNHFFKPIPKK